MVMVVGLIPDMDRTYHRSCVACSSISDSYTRVLIKPKGENMADGFGILIQQNLTGFWIEGDENDSISHSSILERLGWNENRNPIVRYFARVQVPYYEMENFEFDEGSTLPGWAENNVEEIKEVTRKILNKVKPIMKKYHDAVWQLEQERGQAFVKNDGTYTAGLLNSQVASKYNELIYKAKLDMIEAYKKIPGYVPPRENDD
jgi:hypothetical protein